MTHPKLTYILFSVKICSFKLLYVYTCYFLCLTKFYSKFQLIMSVLL